MRRVTVEDAAKLLGLSENAIRKRIERGSLASERANGTRYVLLATDMPRHDNSIPGEAHTLMSRMADEIEFLRRELERKDAIIMTMAQRIPELEPATEPPDARQTPGEGSDGVWDPAPNAEEPEGRQPWWRRIFGV